MPARKKPGQGAPRDADSLQGAALVKETARSIRQARTYWKAHRNGACRRERERALALYERLTAEERTRIPEALRTWLRYRSEKYFGPGRTPPGGGKPGKR